MGREQKILAQRIVALGEVIIEGFANVELGIQEDGDSCNGHNIIRHQWTGQLHNVAIDKRSNLVGYLTFDFQLPGRWLAGADQRSSNW